MAQLTQVSGDGCVIFIISAYHNFLIATLPAMGMWSKSGKRDVVHAQAKPRWVAIESVLTPLSRKLGPSMARAGPAQYYKKARYSSINEFLGLHSLHLISYLGWKLLRCGRSLLNSAHVPFFLPFVCGLACALATPLHCSCYDIIHLFLPCYFFWACRL